MDTTTWQEIWNLWRAGGSIDRDLIVSGLPVYAWIRIGQLLQFLSAGLIILEIIGPPRLKNWGNSLNAKFNAKNTIQFFSLTAMHIFVDGIKNAGRRMQDAIDATPLGSKTHTAAQRKEELERRHDELIKNLQKHVDDKNLAESVVSWVRRISNILFVIVVLALLWATWQGQTEPNELLPRMNPWVNPVTAIGVAVLIATVVPIIAGFILGIAVLLQSLVVWCVEIFAIGLETEYIAQTTRIVTLALAVIGFALAMMDV